MVGTWTLATLVSIDYYDQNLMKMMHGLAMKRVFDLTVAPTLVTLKKSE
jgi:hypothetical protein